MLEQTPPSKETVDAWSPKAIPAERRQESKTKWDHNK